jgi:hypothetical protein
MPKPVAKILCYTLIGGVACWIPDVTLHLLRTYDFSRIDVLAVTILMPLSAFAAYLITIRSFRTEERTPSVAFFMVVGVWLMGPLAMMIAATPTGGGFSQPLAWTGIIVGLLPPYTFMMSAYDSSLAGLAFASLALFCGHLVLEVDHWILPRKFMLWLGLPAA